MSTSIKATHANNSCVTATCLKIELLTIRFIKDRWGHCLIGYYRGTVSPLEFHWNLAQFIHYSLLE